MYMLLHCILQSELAKLQDSERGSREGGDDRGRLTEGERLILLLRQSQTGRSASSKDREKEKQRERGTGESCSGMYADNT